MSQQFKLTKRDGITRRVNFDERPNWSDLSAKIATLFNIPTENVAVSYVDADGDEITLSSDEELREFYGTILPFTSPMIRFTVLDLGSPAKQASAKSETPKAAAPQQPSFRNTFGVPEGFPLVFEVDDEWQSLPGNLGSLFLSKATPESPHAFVEVLESDASLSRNSGDAVSQENETVRSRSPSVVVNIPEPFVHKGKERAREGMQPKVEDDDISSTGSIIGDEAPSKPPVHVFDVSDAEIFSQTPKPFVQNGAITPAQAQSTPLFSEQTLKDIGPEETKEPVNPEADDPPLPTIDINPPAPSLTHDVATLLNNFSSVIASHPELMEGIRHIVTNAANGTYWAAHREAISRAAGNIHRTAAAEAGRSIEEIRRTAEEEAGTRVAEALGRVFRTFSGGPRPSDMHRDDSASAQAPPTDAELPHPHAAFSNVPPVGPPPGRHRDRASWFHPPHHPHHPHHRRPGPFWSTHVPPPPPPPPPPVVVPPIPPVPRSWPRPPPHRFWCRDEFDVNDPRCETRAASGETLTGGIRAPGSSIVFSTPVVENPPTAQTPAPLDSDANLSSPEELRAELERVKADYKARKERYRQAKALRKMSEHRGRDRRESSIERYGYQSHLDLDSDFGRFTSPEGVSRQVSDTPALNQPSTSYSINVPKTPNPNHSATPVAAPVPETTTARAATPVIPVPVSGGDVHIVSNARGPYPQLEMFEVPRRSHTIAHFGHRRAQSEARDRALNRIMRKLSDMGFTESSHPNLNQKVMDQLISNPPTSKDVEDDIVTNVIEELIPSTSNQPRAGSSRDGGIPGAWH
ncbi:hypothetical protein ID866_4551 [Astraeus odoratus]|nr:hypothetical protein ID866_4551 [Astraeus odoratus]